MKPKRKKPFSANAASTKKQCEQCGNEFMPHHTWNRFCSRSCAVVGRSGPSRKNTSTYSCEHCGKIVERNPTKAIYFRYCSRQCKDNSQRDTLLGEKNPNYRNAGRHVCNGCGKEFKHYNKLAKFCSVNCAHVFSKGHPLYAAQIGTRYEMECMAELDKAGFYTGRMQGSRGPFDVFAFNGKEVLLVQVKKTSGRNPPKSSWKSLASLSIPGNVRRQTWIHTRQNQWLKIDL